MLLSDYALPAGGRQIVAWAHPTAGNARICAPALRSNPIESVPGINKLISGGYIVAATDYPGLGTDAPLGFLAGKAEGRAVLDSVIAARQVPGVGGSPRFALWGYSQGAHAALFAANISKAYVPELDLVGTVAAAPPANLQELLHAGTGTVDGRVLAALTMSAWSKLYGTALDGLVDTATAKIISNMTKLSAGDISGDLEMLAAQAPLEHRFLTADPGSLPPGHQLLQQNSIAKVQNSAPPLIAQGTDDEVVRCRVTNGFVEQLCRAGRAVNCEELIMGLPPAPSRQTRSPGLGSGLQDIHSRRTARWNAIEFRQEMTKVIPSSDARNSLATGGFAIVWS